MKETNGFTAHEDSRIDSQLRKHLQIITEEIVKTYGRVYSIILAGGFGRGEGSIRYLPAGGVLPLKDYDIYVITDQVVTEAEFLDMISRIHQELGIQSSWYFSVGPGEFNIGIQAISPRKLVRLPPDIATVDLKLASKVVYGEDLREKIPVGVEDVALSSGAIVLFNKIIGLLEEMNPRYLIEQPEEEKRLSMIYHCGKTYIEICTALTILARRYVPTYSERSKNFQRFYRTEFPQLSATIPDLPRLVDFFTKLKLRSDFESYKENCISLWFDTKDDFNEVLRYYMEKYLHVRLSKDWIEFSKKIYAQMGHIFFREYLYYNLRYMKWYTQSALTPLSMIGQIYDNFLFIKKTYMIKKRLHILPLFFWRSPLLKIFSASVLAFNAIQKDGNINMTLLKESEKYLQRAYPVPYTGSGHIAQWNAIRHACVEAQKLYFTRKEITAI